MIQEYNNRQYKTAKSIASKVVSNIQIETKNKI